MDLASQLRQEARELAMERFGPDVTSFQVDRIYGCEMAKFTFHCATGGDLECTCGAHWSYEGARYMGAATPPETGQE